MSEILHNLKKGAFLGAAKRILVYCMPVSLVGRIRAKRIQRAIQQFPARVVEHLYGGNPLRIYLSDALSQGWYDHDWDELPELSELKKHKLRAGARVFDVGAHQGVVAAMLALAVGSEGHVIAVEANSHNSQTAARNRELNGLSQLEIVEAAISNTTEPLYFNENLNGQIAGGEEYGKRLVKAVTLDGLAKRFGMPDVVFLDVEGAEYLALLGASEVLRSNADFFIEVHVGCGLERLDGSVEKIMRHFPLDRYNILARSNHENNFRVIHENDPITQERFFLLALHRDNV